MSVDAVNWLAQIAALESPALPELASVELWRSLAWGVLLASLLAWVGRNWGLRLRWSAVAGLALWCGVPGALSPPYWLGLAFQAPSISTLGLCVLYLQFSWAQAAGGKGKRLAARAQLAVAGRTVPLVLAFFGVALGWLLLADTLAWTPVAVYAWGFSPLAAAVLLLVLLAPWAWTGHGGSLSLVLALGLTVGFLVLRLPTGNVWDAVLDPWLWVFLHGTLARTWWTRRNKRFNRTYP